MPPALDDFLSLPATVAPAESQAFRRSLLLALICCDIANRWAAAARQPDVSPLSDDQCRRVEDYLQTYPEIRDDCDDVFQLVEAEQLARLDHGHSWNDTEYEQRFPDLADRWAKRTAEAVSPVEIHAGLANIGRFEVIKKLGDGGYGTVYWARDSRPGSQRDVAVKILKRRPEWSDEDWVRQQKELLREGDRVCGLHHPGIVPLLEAGRTTDERVYLVYPLIRGGTLERLLKQKRLSLVQAARLVARVASALDYMHRRQVYHFDIKPSNILLADGSRPLISDFGLARVHQEAGSARGLGTTDYMSPEQLAKRAGLGHQCDIFSLGVVLYRLLCGKLPWQGSSSADRLREIRENRVPSPRMFDHRIPERLAEICERAIARSRKRRYDSARSLADDLRNWLRGEAGRTDAAASLAPQVTTPVAESTPRPDSDTPASEPAIQFRRLGAFKAADAGFFLRLLPGWAPDRLPESLAFWLDWLTDGVQADRHPVGLLGGQTGSGKSSFLQAGLIPHVGPGVHALYVEASPNRTVSDVYRQLHDAGLSRPGESIVATLEAIGRGRRTDSNQKVLLVLDQFEQHLHAHRAQSDDELVAALQTCDGRHWQCLLAVRDGFQSSLAELFERLDVPLDSRRNFGALQQFTREHVEFLLYEFGANIGRLPLDRDRLTPAQRELLSQAARQLTDERAASPVQIALFIEMFRPHAEWTPALLADAGSLDELGVTYLKATFAGPQANPKYVEHGQAVPQLLMKLLPEFGEDEPSAAVQLDDVHPDLMRSRSELDLQTACGYLGQDARFAELMRILSQELPLVTPVEQPAATGAAQVKHYRPTHDFLIPAVRGWIESIYGQTRQGKAELLLRRRTAAWIANSKSAAALPDAWETLRLWWDVPWAKRTGRSREMLHAAMRRHAVRSWLLSGAAVVAILVLAIGGPTMALRLSETTKELGSKNRELTIAKNDADRAARTAEKHAAELDDLNLQQREQLGRMWLERGIRELQDYHYERGWAMLAEAARTLPSDSPLQTSARNFAGDATAPLTLAIPHDSEIIAVAFSPDGRRVVTTCSDCAWMWDVETGVMIGSPLHHRHEVSAIAFSPDGRRVVTGSLEYAQLWDVETGLVIGTPWEHDDGNFRTINRSVNAVAYSPDGRQVVTACEDGYVRLWDAESGTLCGSPWPHFNSESDHLLAPVHSVAFSSDGRCVLSSSWEDQSARLWDVATGKLIGTSWRHEDRVGCVAFSPNGRCAITGCADGLVRLWEVATGTMIGTPWNDGAGPIAFSPDGRWVVTGGWDRFARLWDVDTGAIIRTPWKHQGEITSVAFSPDGRRVLTGCEDGVARLWDTEAGVQIGLPWKQVGKDSFDYTNGVLSVAFNSDGRRVITGSNDGFARLWDVETESILGAPWWHDSSVQSVAFSTDGRRVVTGSFGYARLWDVETGTVVGTPWRHEYYVTSVAFSPDDRRVVTASTNGFPRLWDTATGTQIGAPWSLEEGVHDIEFSPDGQCVVTASNDGVVRFWQAETGTLSGASLQHGDPVGAVAFSPDGRRIITASGKCVRLWDVDTRTKIGASWQHDEWVSFVAFSPDGQRVISGCDKSVLLWDVETGAAIGAPREHDSAVLSVAVSSNGLRIATGCGDYTTRLWDAGRPAVPALAEARGGLTIEQGMVRPLTQGERADRLLAAQANDTKRRLLDEDDQERKGRFHRRAATEAESGRNWFAAEFHLQRLMFEDASNADLLKRLADAQAEQDRWNEATANFGLVRDCRSDQIRDEYNFGLACLGGGDSEGWLQTVQELAEGAESATDASDLDRVPWLGAMRPIDPSLAARLIGFGQRAIQASPQEAFYYESLGAAQYRAGDFVTANETLKLAIRMHSQPTETKERDTPPAALPASDDPPAKISADQGTVWMRLFLAMTCERLGDHVRARESLTSAQREIEEQSTPRDKLPEDSHWKKEPLPDWQERLRWKLIRDEAEALIGKPNPALAPSPVPESAEPTAAPCGPN